MVPSVSVLDPTLSPTTLAKLSSVTRSIAKRRFTMSIATLFFLACFALVALSLAVDFTSSVSRLPKAPPAGVTAAQICRTGGHLAACRDSAENTCANIRCQTRNRGYVNLGKADYNTWCGLRRVCRNGRCVAQRGIPEPTNFDNFVTCPSATR